MMLAACFSCVFVAAIIDPLEHLVWRGKWSATTDAVVLLAIFFPWKATFGLTTATFMALQRVRRYSLCTWIEGFLLMIAAVFAARYHPFAKEIVLYTGAAVVVGRGLAMIVLMKSMRQHSRTLARATGPAWGLSLVAGAAGIFAERAVDLGPRVLEWLPIGFALNAYGAAQQALGDLFPSLGALQGWATTFIDAGRCAVAGGVCVVVGSVLVRLLLAPDLEDAVEQAPSRLRGPLRAALLLSPRSEDQG